MGQRQRQDGPGQTHHVMNRGVAKRLLFEDHVDYRRFTMLMACAVRRGAFEVIAYSLMPNHFHLLIRSNGSLSEGMRRLQNDYSRWFNRRHRRDGPLIRGRFRSRPVHSIAYFRVLLAYLDHNPVSAAICADPGSYPWGSARFYAVGDAPPWLAIEHVHERLERFRRSGEGRRAYYIRLFGSSPPHEVREVVDAELFSRRGVALRLDALLHARPERVRSWMLAKLRNADGLDSWSIVASPSAVRWAVAQVSDEFDFLVHPSRKPASPWPILEVASRFLLAGQSQPAIAASLRLSQSTVSKYVRWHKVLASKNDEYRQAAAKTSSRAIRRTFGNRGDF